MVNTFLISLISYYSTRPKAREIGHENMGNSESIGHIVLEINYAITNAHYQNAKYQQFDCTKQRAYF